MHDLGFVREHMDVIEKMARDRGITLDLGPFTELDAERRRIITSTERMKAERNKANEEIAALKKAEKLEDKSRRDAGATGAAGGAPANSGLQDILAKMKQVSEQIKADDERVSELDERMRAFLLTIPNIPHSSVPVGHSAADNIVVRTSGRAAEI